MKKIAMFLILGVMAASVSAQTASRTTTTGTNSQETKVETTSASQATGGAGGAISNVCVGQCVEQDTSSRDLTDLQIAGIRAATDLQIAKGNQQAARDVAATTTTIKNTPSVSGPALVSSNDTCMGSTSGSANVPGIGIGFGTNWVDENCKMLKNSRELWNMGMKGAAMALMCNDKANREALELTGFECPQTTRDRKVAEAQASKQEITDPIIRARLGMPELTASAK